MHLFSRRIRAHLVKGIVELPSVDLGDGTNSMVEGIRSAGMLADNLWVKAGRNMVAHIGVEHIQLGDER